MENLNNGWIHRESRLPAETDGDSTGKVFAWHAYQGVMLTRWDDFPKNSFNIYWMCLSEGIKAPWIVATERKPTKEDSDALNCVLARSSHGDISITGFHQFDWNSDLTHWLSPLLPPSDYKELRKMQ